MRSWYVPAASVLLLFGTTVPVYADATLFLGTTTTPTHRLTRGLAVGASLIIVGFEFEYASTSEDHTAPAPSLKTGMGNVYAQTPLGVLQFYALLGGGVYRERLGNEQETSIASAVGGGAKLTLAGPLRLRLDYRLFNLGGKPRHDRIHRLYAGLNLMF